MKTHTKLYLDYFGYTTEDFIPCEIPGCGKRANDIHHIKARGMGGDPKGTKDTIENLMALCRKHHLDLGDKKQYMQILTDIHTSIIKAHGKKNGRQPKADS